MYALIVCGEALRSASDFRNLVTALCIFITLNYPKAKTTVIPNRFSGESLP